MSLVVQLPNRIQITLGGGPDTNARWWKSWSFDTMAIPWSHINVADFKLEERNAAGEWSSWFRTSP
ncbi:MAG TPA: hypothetical protein VJ948_13050 [Acidimicrobiia bacterium]|nr:hypothetical protein [Acidimicrobiia bacterium]